MWIRYRRQLLKEEAGCTDEQNIRQIPQKNPAAVILMEEYIHQIMLLCLLSHMDEIVERVMEVMIENHLTHECRI